MSSKQFHFQTEQNVRNAKAKRWTKQFVEEERADREDRTLYPVMPSPKGKYWLDYIKHRVKMMKKGMDVYASDKYSRLGLDKHIRSNSFVDKWVNMITKKKATAVMFGADGEVPPDSHISIKKHVRCPGVRKTIQAMKKRPDCYVKFVDEWGSSQTCPRCVERYQNQRKEAKVKRCRCIPDAKTLLPTTVVTKLGKCDRATYREFQREFDPLIGNDNLHSKKIIYRKIWDLIRLCSVMWQRDVGAAKNIFLKGKIN